MRESSKSYQSIKTANNAMKTYEQIKSLVRYRGTVADGYFNKHQPVGIAYDYRNKETYFVNEVGYYNAGLGKLSSWKEVKRILEGVFDNRLKGRPGKRLSAI